MPRRCSRSLVLGIFTLVLVFAAAAPATALIVQGHDHEGGFFLRLSAGGGGADTSNDFTLGGDTGNIKFSGGVGDLNIAIGGVISPNLTLHGTLWGWTISGPSLDTSLGSVVIPGDLTLSAIGGGVTYYVMPVNLYLSGSAGFGTLSYEGAETDAGFAMDFTVGKEWWVSARWGLGVAGAFGYHSVPEQNHDQNWTGKSVAIRFTATLN